jgi:peptide/nickel transport system substrate-binding protein
MSIRQSYKLFAGATALVMLLAACGTSTPAPTTPTTPTTPTAPTQPSPSTPAPPSVLNIDAGSTQGGGGRLGANFLSWCWVTAGGAQFELFRLVDQRLITLTGDLSQPVGELAEKWEITDKQITFNLRQNAKWHDGTPFTAKDVMFTINTLVNPTTASRHNLVFRGVKGFSEVRSGAAQSLSGMSAPNDYTVVLELNSSDSSFLFRIPDIHMLPEHKFANVPKNEICQQQIWSEGRHGIGPYKFVRYVEGQRVELEANSDYFLGKPKIDKVNLLFFANNETSLAAFTKQETLMAPMSAIDVEYVKGLGFADIYQTNAFVRYLNINGKHPAFGDKRIRQAISFAIDRKAIADTIMLGSGKPATRDLVWLDWLPTPNYDFNPTKAKQLLAEAGYNTNETHVLFYTYQDPITKLAMEAVQQYLAEVGIKVEPRLDQGGALTRARTDGSFALFYGAYGGLHPAMQSTIFACANVGVSIGAHYCNPEFDELINKGTTASTEAEQRKHFSDAFRILGDEVPHVYLFHNFNLIAVNKKLDFAGKVPLGSGNVQYHNFAELWTIR